jgi:2,3-bisphosphoglycerate-independent phosphoglycerate mutase
MITTSESDRDCCRFTEGDAKKGSLGMMRGADVLAKTFAMA